MPNRTEWEIVDDEPQPQSAPRSDLRHVLAGSRWKLACLAALGATAMIGLTILAGMMILVLALIGLTMLSIARLRLALRRFGVPYSKSGDSLNRAVVHSSN